VVQYENLGGLSQPVIGQNKNTADIRLREGEVTILGGLSQLSDSKTVNGIPGLVDIPGVGGTLFGSTNTDKSKSELMIALIPHIVRTPDYTEENLRGIYVGNDAVVKLMRAPAEEGAPPAPAPAPEPAKPEGAKPQPPAIAPALPGAPPAPAAAAPPLPPGVPGQARLRFNPPSVQVATGANVTLTIQADNIKDLFSAAPLKIKYDSMQLRLNDMGPGELLTRDGSRVSSVKEIRNDNGEATLTLGRFPGTGGVSGSGGIVVLNFVAVGKGSSTVSVIDSTLKDSQGKPIPVLLGDVQVKVQ
jgi:general secretion pathway protein D